jgi:hypothetical protein
VDRVVSFATLFGGWDRNGWGRDAVDGGNARTSRILSDREDIGGTVVQSISFFQGEGDCIETTVT